MGCVNRVKLGSGTVSGSVSGGGGGQMCQIGVHFYHIIGVSFQRWLLESVSTHNIDMFRYCIATPRMTTLTLRSMSSFILVDGGTPITRLAHEARSCRHDGYDESRS